jgi:hypothetical protein
MVRVESAGHRLPHKLVRRSSEYRLNINNLHISLPCDCPVSSDLVLNRFLSTDSDDQLHLLSSSFTIKVHLDT